MLARNQSETGVRETATFVLKRLDRVKGDYKVETYRLDIDLPLICSNYTLLSWQLGIFANVDY